MKKPVPFYNLDVIISVGYHVHKTISKHINNALKEELADSVVVAKYANTTQHGAIEGKKQTHEKEYFNLEMVTSVGYRVKSKRGIQFRKAQR